MEAEERYGDPVKPVAYFKKKSCDESQGTQYFFVHRHEGRATPARKSKRDLGRKTDIPREIEFAFYHNEHLYFT
jgi:hypothetical protein